MHPTQDRERAPGPRSAATTAARARRRAPSGSVRLRVSPSSVHRSPSTATRCDQVPPLQKMVTVLVGLPGRLCRRCANVLNRARRPEGAGAGVHAHSATGRQKCGADVWGNCVDSTDLPELLRDGGAATSACRSRRRQGLPSHRLTRGRTHPAPVPGAEVGFEGEGGGRDRRGPTGPRGPPRVARLGIQLPRIQRGGDVSHCERWSTPSPAPEAQQTPHGDRTNAASGQK